MAIRVSNNDNVYRGISNCLTVQINNNINLEKLYKGQMYLLGKLDIPFLCSSSGIKIDEHLVSKDLLNKNIISLLTT